MTNIKQSIANHNKKLINRIENEKHETVTPTHSTTKRCNCRDKTTCPLRGDCLTECVIYQADVTHQKTKTTTTNSYIGLTEKAFKTRFTSHKSSFKLSHKRSSTTLSDHIWSLKDNNKEYDLNWKILAQCKPYEPGMQTCNVCLEEKFLIIKHAPTLNQRNMFFCHCVHTRKFLLEHINRPEEKPPDGAAIDQSLL